MDKRNTYIKMENIKDLTPSERHVVNYLLENQEDIINDTIVELGAKTYTSASTVTRLYKKLQFNSYNEFRNQLNNDVDSYKQSTAKHIQKQKIYVDDDINTIIKKTTHNSVHALFSVRKLNRPETFQEIVNLMSKSEMLHFFGSGVSNLICKDAKQKALRSGHKVTAHQYFSEMIMQARLANKNDLAFIVSYTGETNDIIKINKVLKNKNIKTVSITSDTNNTITNLSDINLFVDNRETFYRVGGMDSRISVQHVFDILFSVYFSQSKQARENIQISFKREDF